MINWLKTSTSTKQNAYIQIAEQTRMSAFVVEKDWWLSRTLEIIFQMDIAQHLVFKGCTSLSKAWKLINRFSEDIDLAIDRDFFEGYKGEISKIKITKLRKEAGIYTTGTFFEELQKEYKAKSFDALEYKVIDTGESDQDPRIIEIYYPNVISQPTAYVLPRVQIEISYRSLREPFTMQTFGSLVDEVYAGRDFTEPLFEVPTVNPERTFLEKLFLLHKEFHRPSSKTRADRLSRHLYYVYHLFNAGIDERAINDKELYKTIVGYRHKFSRVSNVDYYSHNPKTIDPISPTRIIEDWKEDYAKMKEEMIYEENKLLFEGLIDNLNTLKTDLRALNWEFELKFPKS